MGKKFDSPTAKCRYVHSTTPGRYYYIRQRTVKRGSFFTRRFRDDHCCYDFTKSRAAIIRFALADGDDESYDLAVRSDGFSLDAASESAAPDGTLTLGTSSYILFLMGRLPLRRSIRRRRLSFSGDQPLAERFAEWFPGV